MGVAKSATRVERSWASRQTKMARVERRARMEQPSVRPADLAKGFVHVRRSVSQCLERHMKREGRAPSGKVKVSVTVRQTGSVGGLVLHGVPSNSLFATCMRSHRQRWRFPRFTGEPVTVAKLFVIQ